MPSVASDVPTEAFPASVVRFYGNPDFALDTVQNKQIALIRVTMLNDPFDPYGFFETEFRGYPELLKYVREHHDKDRGWFRAHVTPQSWGQTERDLRLYMEKLRKHTFVFCTSAPDEKNHPKDNLYLWGHYANGHRGLAIEFDSKALGAAVQNYHCDKGGAPLVGEEPWIKIGYAQSFRPISARDVFEFMKEERNFYAGQQSQRERTSLDRYYRELSAIKSIVWQPENEWRLMWRSEAEAAAVCKVPINQDGVRAVYLGLALSEVERARIKEAVRGNFPQAELWQASKRFGDLALDFERIV